VVASGRQVVSDGHHLLAGDVGAALTRAIAALDTGARFRVETPSGGA
jgi:hypothetical protein